MSIATEPSTSTTGFLFDTYSYVRRLREAGMNEDQAAIMAETLVSIMENRLVGKWDLLESEARTDRNLQDMETRLRVEIAAIDAKVEATKAELKRDLEASKAELKRDIKELELSSKRDLAETKAEIIKWMFGIAAAQATLFFAMLKMLPGGH